MLSLPINFETTQKKLIMTFDSGIEMALPDLNQEESPTLEFTALKRIRYAARPFFERISIAGQNLFISVGTANNVLASQNAWTTSADGYTLTGLLNLSTAGIAALADLSYVIFEIRLGATSYGQFQTRIRKSVALSGALVTPATDTALGVLQAKRTYVKKEGDPGEGIIFTSADGNSKVFQYLANDGSMQAPPLV